MQAYGPHAGDAAVVAARKGPLELREVHFSYPLRHDMPGTYAFNACSTQSGSTTDLQMIGLAVPALRTALSSLVTWPDLLHELMRLHLHLQHMQVSHVSRVLPDGHMLHPSGSSQLT